MSDGELNEPGGPGAEPRTHDLRLVPAAAAIWAGALLAPLVQPGAAVVSAAVLTVAAGMLALFAPLPVARRKRAHARVARRTWVGVTVVALACAAAGAAGAGLRVAASTTEPLPTMAEHRAIATLRATVVTDPQPSRRASVGPGRSEPLYLVRLRADRLSARGHTFDVRAPVLLLTTSRAWLRLLPGNRVLVSGRLSAPRTGESLAAVLTTGERPQVVGDAPLLQRAAGDLRAGLRESVAGLPAAERGLVPGLVVGDTSQLPAEVDDDFRAAGLSHLTAVSGANVAIVVGLVLAVGRSVGVRGRALPALALAALACFVLVCRPEPSVLRATAMGVVALAALASGRRRAGVPALCAAVVVLLVLDPGLARSVGFGLSVSATAGILVLAPAWRDAFAVRLPRPLAEALAVTAAAQAACTPLLAGVSAQVSLVAVPANLLAVAAVAPATILGLAAAVLAPVSPALAVVPGHLAGIPAWWIVAVARRCAAASGATLPWPGGLGGALLAAVLTAIVVPAAIWLGRRPRLVAASAVLALGLGGLYVISPGWPPRDWRLVACDVGQGDALVLSVAPGSAVVVDAGPEPGLVDGCLDDLGVRQVPLVVLTHFHADHVRGLPGVLRGRAVAEIQVSPYRHPVAEAVDVETWAHRAGVPVTIAAADERRRVAETTWTVLWPRRELTGEGSAENNASIVLAVRSAGVRMLLTGDVEPAAQRAVLASAARLGADVYKVPHHGSRFQEPRLLARVRPTVAVVSAGRDNDYGHPAPATASALRASGALLARTDRDGDVAVVGRRGRLVVLARGVRSQPAQAVASLCHAAGRACRPDIALGRPGHRPGGPAGRPGDPHRGGPSPRRWNARAGSAHRRGRR